LLAAFSSFALASALDPPQAGVAVAMGTSGAVPGW